MSTAASPQRTTRAPPSSSQCWAGTRPRTGRRCSALSGTRTAYIASGACFGTGCTPRAVHLGDGLVIFRVPRALRALWVFMLSAGCHALANWVLYRRACVLSELRFFLSNWAVCFLETVCGWDGGKDAAKPSGSCPASWSRKIVGKYRLCLGLLLLHGSCLAISCHFSQSVRLLVCQISKLFVCTAFFLADVPSSMSLALRTPRRFRGPCL